VPLKCAARADGSDQTSFGIRGVPAVWLQRLPDAANHTPDDVAANLDPQAMQQAGLLLAHTLLSLQPGNLSNPGLPPPAIAAL
jgi:hypothetical protein